MGKTAKAEARKRLYPEHRPRSLVLKEERVMLPPVNSQRARLEALVAREAYGLDAADWQHLTGTFTYGSGDTKAELDEIIARAREAW